MSDHLNLALLCQQSYQITDKDPRYHCIAGVVFMVVQNTIVFRGSATESDWLKDFEAFPISDSLLGKIERGFSQGMKEVFLWLSKNGPHNPIITGHSLGGAHAVILAGYYKAMHIPFSELVTFGCPRPGYAELRNLLKGSDMTAYRNGADIVPTEPPAFLWWLYRSYTDWTRIGKSDDPLLDHLIANYIKAMRQSSGQSSA